MPLSPRPALRALAAVALAVLISACGSSSSTTSNAATTTAATAAATASTTAGAVKKVSANTASAAEIIAALTANGVPNAARWAKEVQEYRPYPAEDPSLARLRQNLEKYQPGDDVMNKILAALTP